MAKGEEIVMADVMGAPRRAGDERLRARRRRRHHLPHRLGDALERPTTYNDGCPGIGMEVARWIAEDVQAGVTGGDTWPVDAVPNPDPDCVFCVHQYLQTRQGSSTRRT